MFKMKLLSCIFAAATALTACDAAVAAPAKEIPLNTEMNILATGCIKLEHARGMIELQKEHNLQAFMPAMRAAIQAGACFSGMVGQATFEKVVEVHEDVPFGDIKKTGYIYLVRLKDGSAVYVLSTAPPAGEDA